MDALGGLIEHAATRHTAASTAQFFAGLITPGLYREFVLLITTVADALWRDAGQRGLSRARTTTPISLVEFQSSANCKAERLDAVSRIGPTHFIANGSTLAPLNDRFADNREATATGSFWPRLCGNAFSRQSANVKGCPTPAHAKGVAGAGEM